MKQKFLILLLFPLSITTQASPEKKLYATVKNNSVCIFTNDAKTQPYNNQIYLYLGHIIQGHVALSYSIILIISSYIGAQIGVKINHSIKSETVVLLLRTVMLIMGVYLIIKSFL